MTKTEMGDLAAYSKSLASRARSAAETLTEASVEQKNRVLTDMAASVRNSAKRLKAENAKDMANAKDAGLSQAMLERLELDDKRIEAMAVSLEQVAAQIDPVGQIIEGYVRPNGLEIQRVRVPIGVVAIIFESRPNVTADAAGLCLRSGNACILRGGKEAINSNLAIADCLRKALAGNDMPLDAVQVVETTDRALVGELLKQEGLIDVVIPRGGESLIRAVVEQSRIPVIKHYTGNCHVYIDRYADLELAERIVVNAKCQRPSVCNAAETILIHRDVAEQFVPVVCQSLSKEGVEIRGCEETASICAAVKPADEADWSTEYLDLIVAMKIVENIDQAITHINTLGSHHTDAIVSTNVTAVDRFVKKVDSASVMVNTSTRFSDGFEYGLGAEIGISTDKLHARGPMGARDLTTYKYVVRGNGQLRG